MGARRQENVLLGKPGREAFKLLLRQLFLGLTGGHGDGPRKGPLLEGGNGMHSYDTQGKSHRR